MAMKVYTVTIGGLPHTLQYPEGEQPEGAVEVQSKRATPKNKARTPRNKKVTDGDAAPAADRG